MISGQTYIRDKTEEGVFQPYIFRYLVFVVVLGVKQFKSTS